MSYLLDANILCRIARPDDPQHAVARDAVRRLIQNGEELIVTSQVAREFWVVATRPRDQNGLGMSPAETSANLESFNEFTSFQPDNAAVYENWIDLVVKHNVAGKEAHDANLVATMLAHKIVAILTFDQSDFRRYERLVQVHTPEQVIAETKTQ